MAAATCSTGVYPPAVIAAVQKQVKEATIGPDIPESMRLKPSMRESRLDDAIMVELEIDNTHKTVKEVDVVLGSEMIHRHTGHVGSICFVALSLSVLKALYGECLDGFQIFGIVKESNVDEEGLVDFSTKYFGRFPLYCDKSYAFYRALGDRHVTLGSLLSNPFSIFSILCDTYQRLTSKQIDGTAKGEGLVQGGIVFFDASGNPVCASEEETGVDLRIEDLLTAAETMRRNHTAAASAASTAAVSETATTESTPST